jgi:hypothetical protein
VGLIRYYDANLDLAPFQGDQIRLDVPRVETAELSPSPLRPLGQQAIRYRPGVFSEKRSSV